jgi:hypothetical protein
MIGPVFGRRISSQKQLAIFLISAMCLIHCLRAELWCGVLSRLGTGLMPASDRFLGRDRMSFSLPNADVA